MIDSYVDILLVLIIAFSVLRGWQNGFVLGMIDLLSWVGSLLAAFRWYGAVADLLLAVVDLPEALARPLAFALTAILAGLLLSLMGRAFLDRLPHWLHQDEVNRLFGILPGLVSGLVAAAIVSSLLMALPLSGVPLVETRQSALASRFASLTEPLEAGLRPIFGDAIDQTLNMLTVHPESDELVELPYTVGNPVVVPELEAEMLALINEERAAVGLHALQMDPELVVVARQHSIDMFARGYFAHVTPEGASPFDRMQQGGVRYRTAGENLAHAPTLEIAHNGLMNSPGHRENILRPQFGRVGIGILDGGPRGLMITQNFRD
jgi:uncharacterized protein YkwD